MMRNRTLRALVAAAAIAAVPAVLSAQQAGANAIPQTHTVVAGETLWSLAQRYLSDPYRWHEIYDLNKATVADPHWIYPGQVLRLPGAVTSVAVTVAPAPAAVTPVVVPVDTVRRAPVVPTVNPATAPTVFRRVTAAANAPETDNQAGPPQPTVLMGEYVRAPYVTKAGSMNGDGRVIKSADIGASGEPSPWTIFKAYDEVLVQPPAGVPANKGDRFVTLASRRVLPGLGQVVVPTGVLEITQPAGNGAAARAQVVELFGEMNPGQLLVPIDTAGVSSTVRPTPVEGGRSGSIQWILSSPVLPTMQAYAVLNLTVADGVKVGDQLLVFRAATPAAETGQPSSPEVPIGRAQVIKVTPFGTTAIVTAQEQPAINVGAMVRVMAKMP